VDEIAFSLRSTIACTLAHDSARRVRGQLMFPVRDQTRFSTGTVTTGDSYGA